MNLNSHLDKLKIAILVLSMTGCAVRTNGAGGSYEPTLATNFIGLVAVEMSSDLSTAYPSMQRACAMYGGLLPGSSKKVSAPPSHPLWNFDHTYWSYQCQGPTQRLSQPVNQNFPQSIRPTFDPLPTNSPKISPLQAREKCKELGFKEGTDALAECGLKLLR